MSTDRGFVHVDLLLEGVAVLGVLALIALGGVQVTRAVAGMAESREHALYEALRSDLDELRALQSLHHAKRSTYSASPEALGFTSRAEASVSIQATLWGWSATATHPRLGPGEGCAIYQGHTLLPATPITPREAGEVVCTAP